LCSQEYTGGAGGESMEKKTSRIPGLQGKRESRLGPGFESIPLGKGPKREPVSRQDFS